MGSLLPEMLLGREGLLLKSPEAVDRTNLRNGPSQGESRKDDRNHRSNVVVTDPIEDLVVIHIRNEITTRSVNDRTNNQEKYRRGRIVVLQHRH